MNHESGEAGGGVTDPGDEAEIVSAPVGIRLDALEMVGKGRLVALAHVTLTVGDIEMRIHGLQITRDYVGWLCKSPLYRDSSGIWRQCVGLPQTHLQCGSGTRWR